MANENEKTGAISIQGHVDMSAVSDKPEIAAKPSFLKDVKNGLVHVAKTLWAVPEARGFIATLLVRYGIPSGLVAIGMAVGDKLAG